MSLANILISSNKEILIISIKKHYYNLRDEEKIMSLKDKWKDFGKDVGGAFSNFGKAVATTARVVVEDEEKTNEEGDSKLKEAWSKTGKSFGEAGKSLGHAASGTAQKAFGEEKEEFTPDEDKVVEEYPETNEE